MKININKIIKKIKNDVYIIEKLNITQTKKNLLFKKISKLYKRYLKKKNISIFTYSKYITLIRKQFINIKHHNLYKNINNLIKIFKCYKKELKILKNKNIKNIFKKIYKLKKKLSKIDILLFNLNKIKFKKNNLKLIKKIYKKIPEWKKEINIFIKKKWYKGNKFIINKISNGIKLLKKINKIKINHEILFYLKIEKNKLNKIKQNSLYSLKKKKNNTIKINYKKYMQKIFNILNNNNKLDSFKEISYLSFSLSLISGRRMIEILYTGKFKIINKYEILFKGQVKNYNKKKKYKIYILLINTKNFIKKIKKLRSCKKIKKIIKKIKKKKNKIISINEQISNNISPHFNKWVKYLFKNKKTKYKDSRSIYSKIAFKKWFKKDKKWKNKDEDIFFTKILGHKNINSQMYYKQFKIYNFNEKWKPKIKKNKRLKNLIKLDNKLNNIIKHKKSYKIHEITKKIIKKNPNKLITNYLLRKYKFNNKLIQRYINFIYKKINQKKKNNRLIIKK